MTTLLRPLRLAAATLVLALAGGLAPVAQAQPMPGPALFMGGPHHMEHALRAVGATPEQMARVKAILEAARSDLEAMRGNDRALHDQARQLFSQPVVDPAAAEALRQKMLARHDQASKRVLQAQLELSRVLSAEQRGQLMAIAAAMHEGMHDHMHEGMGAEGMHGGHGPDGPEHDWHGHGPQHAASGAMGQ